MFQVPAGLVIPPPAPHPIHTHTHTPFVLNGVRQMHFSTTLFPGSLLFLSPGDPCNEADYSVLLAINMSVF